MKIKIFQDIKHENIRWRLAQDETQGFESKLSPEYKCIQHGHVRQWREKKHTNCARLTAC